MRRTQKFIVMKKSEFILIVEAGGNVTANAHKFTLAEIRLLARKAVCSGAVVTVAHGDVFLPHELLTIAEEGKSHVTFPDLKVD